MTYNYKNKEYIIEYAVVGVEDFDVWLQNPNDMNDFHYIETLPENVQDELYSMVAQDFDDAKRSDENEMIGYLD